VEEVAAFLMLKSNRNERSYNVSRNMQCNFTGSTFYNIYIYIYILDVQIFEEISRVFRMQAIIII